MKRNDLIILGILLTAALLALIPHHLVIDGNHPVISVECFNDSANGGGSKTFPGNDTVLCETRYFVSSQYEFPYVGIGFFVDSESQLIDLSSYQTMTIDIDPAKTDKFNCQISFFVDGFSHMEDGPTQQVLLTPVIVEPNKERYSFEFKNLPTPQWWFQTNNISEEQVPPLDHKRFSGISFSNHPLLPRDKEYRLLVKRVVFTKRYYKTSLFFALLFLIYGLFLLFRKKAVVTFVPYQPVALSKTGGEEDRLLTCLGRTYMLSGLSLEDVSRETSLSQSKVRQILRKRFSLSFKQYLNHLRISEAVRLIKETDNPISEIGLSVGYKHVSTFNTTFKNLYGMSPTQLRSEQKK